MNNQLPIRNKYYPWLPIRFFVEKIIRDMTIKTVDSLEDFIEEKEYIIDIGAGAGWISQEIQRRRKTKNTLLDVINLNQTDLPLIIYDGKNMPFDDNTFDTALLICVLHHCKDPCGVLKEAKRIVRKRIIIIEDIARNPIGRIALCLKDAILNIGFCLLVNSLKEITNLPFHFKRISEWEEIFEHLNLKIVYKRESRPQINNHSVIFIVQK